MNRLKKAMMLQNYLKDRDADHYERHPGKAVLLVLGEEEKVKETFFDTKHEAQQATKGMDSIDYLIGMVPLKTHRFNPENRTLEYREQEYVDVCPNDGETGLRGGTIVGNMQRAVCPDCKYTVYRMPLPSDADAAQKRLEVITKESSPTA